MAFPLSFRRKTALPALLCCVVLATLPGCGEKTQTAPSAERGAASAVADGAAAEPPVARDPDALIAAAGVALANDRLFSPPGDNALELLLQVIESDPGNRRAQAGLVDILPFVLIGLEQRLTSGDLDEAERLLFLFRKADARHPALARLESRILAARQEQAAAEASRLAAQAERERQEALARQAASAAAPASAQASQPPTPQAPVTAATPASAPAQTAAPSPAAASPPVVSDAPPVAAPMAPVRTVSSALPPIVNQVAPRYPAQAQRRRLEGMVEVEFTIAANGSVSSVRVLRSEPAGVFDREAIGAMQRWRFEPTGRDMVGRRVFDFKLGES